MAKQIVMEIVFHRTFKKQYNKLPQKIQSRFGERLQILLEDDTDPLLRLHKLSGNRKFLYSINVNADYRALFVKTKTVITFLEIGTHSELYT